MRHAESTNCLRFSFVGGKAEEIAKTPFLCVSRISLKCEFDRNGFELTVDRQLRSIRRHNDSGCLPTLLYRPHELQQVRIDLICIRGGEAMRQAWVENLLSSLYELGRSLS